MPNARRSRFPLLAVLLALATLATPWVSAPVVAHEGHDHGDDPVEDGSVTPAPLAEGVWGNETEGVNLTEMPWYSGHRGRLFLGNLTNLTLPANMTPTSLRAASGWLAWFAASEGGSTNVYLYDPDSAQGYWVTNSSGHKTDLALSADSVAWVEWARNYTVRVHRITEGITLDVTNETRRPGPLALGNGHLAFPRSVSRTDSHVVVVDLSTGETEVLTSEPGKREDIAFAGDLLVWRDQSYSLVDVGFHRLSTGERGFLTRDAADERRILSDGRDFYWTHYTGTRTDPIWRFDASTERAVQSPVENYRLSDMTASNGLFAIRSSAANGTTTVSVANARTGVVSVVASELPLLEAPAFADGTLYLLARTPTGAELLRLIPSPFAYRQAPTLVINGPLGGTTWRTPFALRGFVDASEGWGTLTGFRYRASGSEEWTPVPGVGRNFSFVIDPKDYPEGRNVFQVEALFANAPAVSEFKFQLLGHPVTTSIVDNFDPLRETATAGAFDAAIRNPGTVFTALFLAVGLVLLLVRVVLWIRQRPGRVEYVRPDEGEEITPAPPRRPSPPGT